MAGKNEVTLTFAGDTKQIEKAFDRVGAGAKKLGGEVETGRDKFKRWNKVAVGASLAVAGAVGTLGVQSFNLSQELTKLDDKAGAVFAGQLGDMKAWAEQNKAAFGTSRDQVVGLAANFADLLKPMGFTTKEAAGMSKEVLGLSGALANWSQGQYEAAEVSEILSKAMLGERDQLKQLGISISEADVQARLAKNGQDELTGAALEQAKAIATQQLITEKSTDAQAAWANGGRQAAEAQNASKVAMQEMQESLARGLTPAFEAGTKVVATFSQWAEKNQQTVAVLAGVVVGLAGAVLSINAAFKVYQAVTRVAAAAQWALNVAMSANPIGLVVIAIAALAAGLVFAYKRSETFRSIVNRAWESVKAGARTVGNAVSNIISWFSRMRSSISSVMSGMAAAIAGPFRSAFSGIRSAWNSTIGGRGFDVPSWVPGVGGRSFRIPFLAEGGIVTSPTLAMIGEAGPEKVVPLDRADRGMGGPVVLRIDSGGSALDDLLVEILREAVRAEGGVVATFGPL